MVKAADVTHASSIAIGGGYQTLGWTKLSSTALFNRIGYAGYQADGILSENRIYHVRHRVFSTDLGRWTRRDPLGFHDGMGLYEYVGSMVVTMIDEDGLAGVSTVTGGYAQPDACGGYGAGVDMPPSTGGCAATDTCGGYVGWDPGYTIPYPLGPCGTQARQDACNRWATQQCTSKLGCAKSATCCNECINSMAAFCNKSGCNSPGSELKCLNKGFNAMATCNGLPTWQDRKDCMAACTAAAVTGCGRICSYCIGQFDFLKIMIDCVLGCGVGKKCLQDPGIIACIKGCGTAWLAQVAFYCPACGSCILSAHAICNTECFVLW
jgi:RHS repeat-associated protein